MHESIRAALENSGNKDFDTFLQGSYRNGTAVADINDVDIAALYDPWASPQPHSRWLWLFDHVAAILRNSTLSCPVTVSLGDKCIKLDGALKADIVPAISKSAYSSTDPIMIYSRRKRADRANYPRTHYRHDVRKQSDTNDTYKPTVRLFKRWARQYDTLTAPSFYVECAVHSVPSSEFDTYLPLSFASVAVNLLSYTRRTTIPSVAGDKDILVSSEWDANDFEDFQSRLRRDVRLVFAAMQASTVEDADRLWRLTFGD